MTPRRPLFLALRTLLLVLGVATIGCAHGRPVFESRRAESYAAPSAPAASAAKPKSAVTAERAAGPKTTLEIGSNAE